MYLFGIDLGNLIYGHSVVGLLAASFILAPLAILIVYYGLLALLIYVALTRADRVVRWIGPSKYPRQALSAAPSPSR